MSDFLSNSHFRFFFLEISSLWTEASKARLLGFCHPLSKILTIRAKVRISQNRWKIRKSLTGSILRTAINLLAWRML